MSPKSKIHMTAVYRFSPKAISTFLRGDVASEYHQGSGSISRFSVRLSESNKFENLVTHQSVVRYRESLIYDIYAYVI